MRKIFLAFVFFLNDITLGKLECEGVVWWGGKREKRERERTLQRENIRERESMRESIREREH